MNKLNNTMSVRQSFNFENKFMAACIRDEIVLEKGFYPL
jgi:hypothetical protein